MSSWRAIDPAEMWMRRHLALMLSVREIRIRYKQSMMGGLWAVVRPLVMMLVFTFLFGSVAKLSGGDVPYPLYVFAALIGWDLFANVVTGCAGSITKNRVLVERMYCPRLLFPLSSVMVALFDFAIAGVIFAVLMALMGVAPSPNIVWLPLLVLGVVLAGLSVGLWLAAMAVWLHDVKFAVTYLMQLLLLLTPVGYGAANVPEKYAFIVTYNPMATLVEAFRWSILGVPMPEASAAGLSAAVLAVMLGGGLMFFNALERSFADVV
jgi:lipopolysaccharide transport system permease protein